jgi:hypothetical protein
VTRFGTSTRELVEKARADRSSERGDEFRWPHGVGNADSVVDVPLIDDFECSVRGAE